nr:hypothetical protein GCM10020093_000200 [Planobispora longispora]
MPDRAEPAAVPDADDAAGSEAAKEDAAAEAMTAEKDAAAEGTRRLRGTGPGLRAGGSRGSRRGGGG